MSSNNAVLVLCLKDQYRVIEAFAIDNLYWSWNKVDVGSTLVMSRVFDYFKGAKKFPNREEAFSFASALSNKIYLLEYGIIPVEINLTWRQVLEEARKDLVEEKLFVLNNPQTNNTLDIVENLNFSYGDVLKHLNKEKHAKQ